MAKHRCCGSYTYTIIHGTLSLMTFNLVRDPWIPVVVCGERQLVSLREAFSSLETIEGLSLADPLQAIAVYRQVLLPVALDALGAPRSTREWGDRLDCFDVARVLGYLESVVDRFELFDERRPFAQVAGLQAVSGEIKPLSAILPAIASGNNVPLFSVHSEVDPPELSPAAAVPALLSVQCWDTAAIKTGASGDPAVQGGKTTGNPTGPLGALGIVLPLGRNLAETLAVNTPIVPQGLRAEDRPQWRASPPLGPTWERRPAHGLLDLLTWQSRRVRLVYDTKGTGETVIRGVVVAAGDRLDETPIWEPHTAWSRVDRSTSGQPVAWLPARHQSGRAVWRSLTSLLAARPPSSERLSTSSLISQLDELRDAGVVSERLPLQLFAVGVLYGNKSAVIEDVFVDTIPLPITALAHDSHVRQLLEEIVSQAEQLRQAADRLENNLRLAKGGDKLPESQGQHLGQQLIYRFDPVVRRIVSALQSHPARVDEADQIWRSTARQIAREVAEPYLSSVPPTAFYGHEPPKDKQGRHGPIMRQSTAEDFYQRAITKALGPLVEVNSATTE